MTGKMMRRRICVSTEKKSVPDGTLEKLNTVAAASAMEVEDGTRPIDVSMGKLVGGVSLIFAGVLRLLSALECDNPCAAPDSGAGNAAEDDKPAGDGSAGAEPPNRAEPSTGAEPVNEKAAAGDEDKPTSAEDKPEETDSPQEAPLPSVTADDITKVIVRKIKQNRSNAQKIGSILKTFGVSKVSELPAGQYEAFLTEQSQL
jgi:hypothetical protein